MVKNIKLLMMIIVLISLAACKNSENKEEKVTTDLKKLTKEEINNLNIIGTWNGTGLEDEYSKTICTIELLNNSNATYSFKIQDKNGNSIKGLPGNKVSTTYTDKILELTDDSGKGINYRCITLYKTGLALDNYSDKDYIFALNDYGFLQGIGGDINGLTLSKNN